MRPESITLSQYGCPMSPPQMYLARLQWQPLQLITASLSTPGHSASFWSGWPFCGGLRDDLSIALVSTWKTPSWTWLTPRALLPAAHKIYNGHYADDLPDECPNIFGIKNEFVLANHCQWCVAAALFGCGGETKKEKGRQKARRENNTGEWWSKQNWRNWRNWRTRKNTRLDVRILWSAGHSWPSCCPCPARMRTIGNENIHEKVFTPRMQYNCVLLCWKDGDEWMSQSIYLLCPIVTSPFHVQKACKEVKSIQTCHSLLRGWGYPALP